MGDVIEEFSDATLEEMNTTELAMMIPIREDNWDTNKGPYAAWYAAHTCVPSAGWIMLGEHAWLRWRAYVFWDWAHIQQKDLLKIFATIRDEDYEPSPEDFEEMEESFDQRSQIWEERGTGYWSKDDTSRIVWPSP
ncbi:hypothetical protein BDP81DRAFT_414319 [Colletotrichum phormii]|uniref:Uncharacterized protein n=1 Tax=Colletotrichum phormii TaxID=359342 RepID=A0AAJ0A5B0_9PEZI|nr:uncharacterized protein BDP81DRAFT_414319 [Colletotrichum phormii]KAK1656168.1 hypothetical protein BDP81DRAFT_414319 [Colletotrichum phormii]